MSAALEAEWRAALAEGRLMLQRARGSGDHFFPPRLAAPRTGDTEWDWVEASGLGTVYSATVVQPRPPAEPYNVVLVDLDEGVRLMSRVEGVGPDEPLIGLRVKMAIGEAEGAPLLLFERA